MRVKRSIQPPPAPTARAVGPCPTVIQIVGRPGTGSLPRAIAPPDNPLEIVNSFCDNTGMRLNVKKAAAKGSRSYLMSQFTTPLRVGGEDVVVVVVFWLNGRLRQYFSLYRAVSQREIERQEK